MALRIEDYAVIGDCETAALVGRDGSIDWLCFPRFDSGACFAALLGTEEHGRWRIAPEAEVTRVSRRYRGDTLILETDMETADGAVTIVDFMPPRTVHPDLVRIVVGRRGTVKMQMDFVVRFDYGSVVPWVQNVESGLWAVAGPETLHLETPVEMHGENFHTVAEFTVSEGERIPFTLTWFPSHLKSPPSRNPEEELASTERWWREWSSKCSYDGPYRDLVMRSLITLKAMTYAPTGGVVAAITTSLPEAIGGVRNWDYRFCWLRDATFTLYSLITGGYHEEAAAWREWLLRAVAGKPSQMQIMYGLAGERRLTELELDWLPGYEGSRPVRIGNAASEQVQLDVYGELMDALHLMRRLGVDHDDNVWRLQLQLMKHLETAWRQPDEGIWEVRGQKRHFTHSKVMAWVAVDRAIKGVECFQFDGPVEEWRAMRDEIHAEVCREGFNPQMNSFVQYYGAEHVDASLLLIPLVGFLPASDPRVVGTLEAVRRDLMHGDFVARYPEAPHVDGLPGGEGSFLLCTFWYIDNLILQDRGDEAREHFERLISHCNDVGLLSEQFDPVEKRALGNFPQAFSHVGLINTARNLARHGGPAEDRNQRQAAYEC